MNSFSYLQSLGSDGHEIITPVSEKMKVINDSGADGGFMHQDIANQCKLTVCALPQLLEASVFYGRLFYRVTHHTEPVQIITTQGKLETHKFPHDSLPIMPLSFGLPGCQNTIST